METRIRGLKTISDKTLLILKKKLSTYELEFFTDFSFPAYFDMDNDLITLLA
jgi:hypothetical protein